MFKVKGKLEIKEFTDINEAKVDNRQPKPIRKAASIPRPKPMLPPGSDKQEDTDSAGSAGKPFKTKIPPRRILVVMFAIILACVAVSIVFDMWESGEVAINELTAKNVLVNINSHPQIVATNAETVDELLKEMDIKIGAEDYMDKGRNQQITDGMSIWIRQSVPVTIVVADKTYHIETQPVTVEKALSLAGITARSGDNISQPLLSYIYDETKIVVDRVDVKTETVDEYVEQDEIEEEQSYLAPGVRVTISEGSPGVNRNTYEVIYENGAEIGRELISSEKVRDPVSRVVGVGPADSTGTATKAMATTSDGASFYYTSSMTVEATAYTWTGNRTATGTWPKVGTIAVDPKVIPLGTKVYVSGYGFAVAEDTGGAIKNNIIDLYMDTNEACINWGRRNVTLYILE